MGNSGGGTDRAGRGCGRGQEAALRGGLEIWVRADVTWISWHSTVPDWTLVSLGGGNVGGLVSIAIDDNNDDDDYFNTNDDWAVTCGWSGVWWSSEDSASLGWGSSGDQSGVINRLGNSGCVGGVDHGGQVSRGGVKEVGRCDVLGNKDG